jgi:hypothetical protein
MFLFGCGRKSNPKSPENFAPGPVQFLSAAASQDGVTLSWSMPLQTAGGEALKADSVRTFLVKKSEVIPERKPRMEDIGEVVIVEPKVSSVPTISQRDDSGNLRPVGSVLGSGDKKKEELANRVFKFIDKNVTSGVRYLYQVVGVNADDVEGPSHKTLRVTFDGDKSKVETITKLDSASGDDPAFSY